MSGTLSLIIVTHNSEQFISRCVDSIDRQTVTPDQVIIVDSGSDDPSYLDVYRAREEFQVNLSDNIGFAAGNNYGMRCIAGDPRYILFINPDIILEPDNIERAIDALQEHSSVAIVSGRLKGYDTIAGAATGLLDSTGIFRTWYGRWYDRGQGHEDHDNFRERQEVPALCGAFMFCRAASLDEERPEIFDEAFFMYKEDIDLCLRLGQRGWKMLYLPEIETFHGRGWAKDRSDIAYPTRCMASRNEIVLNLKHRSPYLAWALLKYLLVRVLHV